VGVVTAALSTVVGIVLAAWFTMRVERRFVGPEPGPAASDAFPAFRPSSVDRWMYAAAPAVALAGACSAMVVIPFGPTLVGRDLTVGLFYYLVVLDYLALAIAMGGWGADTPKSVEACYRAIAQLVAYVVPLGLAIIGPLMMARSLQTVEIVSAQHRAGLWYIVAQPQGFALYIATALMQTYRAPFLEPFASRIDGGVYSVYGGWRAMVWRLAFAGLLFVVAAMGAVLFLGGYSGPLLPPPVWMLAKTFAVMALMLWVGRRARLRSAAETVALAWKVLIPAGLVNILIVGALILLGVGQDAFR
jgi:NADH-quinone oxidoreductase subunit H